MEQSRSTTARASVVIPTFNGAKRVPGVLAALAIQSVPDGTFEVVLVDNNSSDGTGEVIDNHPTTLQLRSRGIGCRIVHEPAQGLANARIRGVIESRTELVCFLDDDNIPDVHYIGVGIESFADPSVGLVVSKVRAVWETPPPPSLQRQRLHLFACNEFLGDEPFEFGAMTIAPTVGAGLWIKRAAFLEAIPWTAPSSMLSDRTGSALTAGNDIEIGVLIGRAGHKRMYNPALRIDHLLPAARQSVPYVRRLIDGTVRSELALREKYEGRSYGSMAQAAAVARWLGAMMTIPPLPLVRLDWKREAQFILADRWARVKGPHRPANARKS